MNEITKTPLMSTRFIIMSLLSLAIIMAYVFTSVVVHAATPFL